jgi:hypothetical protein
VQSEMQAEFFAGRAHALGACRVERVERVRFGIELHVDVAYAVPCSPLDTLFKTDAPAEVNADPVLEIHAWLQWCGGGLTSPSRGREHAAVGEWSQAEIVALSLFCRNLRGAISAGSPSRSRLPPSGAPARAIRMGNRMEQYLRHTRESVIFSA